ncbi:hypothetical protein MMC27_006661 [Xylographa pallens]|nr:hypothetical protein [Xylographa pallens]
MGALIDRSVWIILIVLTVYACKRLTQYHLHKISLRRHGCSTLPKYPHKDPILGLDLFYNFIKSIQDGNTIAPDMRRHEENGKTYEANSWGSTMIFTMDASNMQTMFTSAFDNFTVASLRYGPSIPLLGSGIFTTDGRQWQHSRDLIKPIFARAQISNLDAFEKHVKRMIDSLPRDGSTIELQQYFKLLFLDQSTEFIFGESADTLLGKESDSDAHQLRTGFDNAMSCIHTRWFLGKFSFLLGPQLEYRRTCAKVHTVVEKYIDKSIQKYRSRVAKEVQEERGQKCVLLDELVQAGVERMDIRDQVLGVFFPARDTTAIGVGNVFFYLARYPDVWKKLRTEALAVDQPLTFESLKSLKYLSYVINETFRLVLPASRTLRTCVKTTVLPHGGGPDGMSPILVQPGTQIDTNFRAMHLDTSIWGHDAAIFRPERWEGMKPLWQYIPFLGGKRMCPAQQMVLTETAYVIVRMLQEFSDIENRDPVKEYVEAYIFTMESKNGVRVSLTPAK